MYDAYMLQAITIH